MANSSVPITPGTGAPIAVNSTGGIDYQVIKLDFGADGLSSPAQADGSGNLKVSLAAAPAQITIVPAASQQFPVVNAPATTLAVSASAALPVSAGPSGPVSVRISNGTANVDTLPVSGTVTGNQGAAAAVGSAWPIKISDGTNTAPLDSSNGNALKVSVVAAVSPQALADKATFTEGTSLVSPIAGEYNSSPSSPSSGQAAAVQITQNRGLHVNLRSNAGAEIGSSGAPIRVDPTGTTLQPVGLNQVGGNNIVTVASGVLQVGLGNATGAVTTLNPVPVTPVPNAGTFWSIHVAYTAGQSSITLRSPTSGKTSKVHGLVLVPTGAGTLEVFDNSASAANDLLNGTMPASGCFHIPFNPPRPLSAVNNILRYTSGSG